MGYNQSVTTSTAHIPSANVAEALRRLAGLGFRAEYIDEAFGNAGWAGDCDSDGSYNLGWFEHDWPDDEQKAAVIELGDLFTAGGLVGWLGEDKEIWGWRLNYKGRAFSEVNARIEYDEPFAGTPEDRFVESVLEIADPGTKWPVEQANAVAKTARAYVTLNPIPPAGPDSGGEVQEAIETALHAQKFVQEFSRQQYAAGDTLWDRDFVHSRPGDDRFRRSNFLVTDDSRSTPSYGPEL